MGAKFRWRKTLPLGPLRFHFSNGRFTGWGLRIWRWTWSARTGRHSLDTPGPGSIHFSGRRWR